MNWRLLMKMDTKTWKYSYQSYIIYYPLFQE